MQLERRGMEWQVVKGLCRGVTNPQWQSLWVDACALCPEAFTHADLGMVFKILQRLRTVSIREWIPNPASFREAFGQELEMVSLGAFNVEGLLTAVPTDWCLPAIREEIRALLREQRGIS